MVPMDRKWTPVHPVEVLRTRSVVIESLISERQHQGPLPQSLSRTQLVYHNI